MIGPIEFIERFVSVRQEDKRCGVLLDDLMAELINSLVDDDRVIARYPRRIGKTTTLMGYVLYRLLTRKRASILYMSGRTASNIYFLQSLAYAFHHLPRDIRQSKTCVESADRFSIGDSTLYTITRNMSGMRPDLILFDDVANLNESRVLQDVANAGAKRAAIVGTFPLYSELGKLWINNTTILSEWMSIPTVSQRWKVDVVLSMCDPMFQKGY